MFKYVNPPPSPPPQKKRPVSVWRPNESRHEFTLENDELAYEFTVFDYLPSYLVAPDYEP
jgi:hypothetical protein